MLVVARVFFPAVRYTVSVTAAHSAADCAPGRKDSTPREKSGTVARATFVPIATNRQQGGDMSGLSLDSVEVVGARRGDRRYAARSPGCRRRCR